MNARPPSSSPTTTPSNANGPRRSPAGIAAPPSAQVLLRVDGVFEGVVGFVLILSPATGLASALALPARVATPIAIVVGLLLLALFPALWLLARSAQPRLVRALAMANGAGAVTLSLWVLIWHGAFRPAGAAFVLCVAVILATLAVLQSLAALAAS